MSPQIAKRIINHLIANKFQETMNFANYAKFRIVEYFTKSSIAICISYRNGCIFCGNLLLQITVYILMCVLKNYGMDCAVIIKNRLSNACVFTPIKMRRKIIAQKFERMNDFIVERGNILSYTWISIIILSTKIFRQLYFTAN